MQRPRDNYRERCSLNLREYLFVGQSPLLALRITGFDWGGQVIDNHANGSDGRRNEPSKLMISFLAMPSFNSCLFKLTSFRAIIRPCSLFHRRFRIPGLLELLYTHVMSPGNHPVMDMRKTSNRVGFPKAPKLAEGADG